MISIKRYENTYVFLSIDNQQPKLTVLPRISSATDQGSRLYQEDRLLIKRVDATALGGTLLAVADGHGGDQTSSYVEQQLAGGLFERMLTEAKGPVDALKKTFQHLHDSTLESSKRTGSHYESGTTLSVVFIPDGRDRAYIGIIGDSPVIVARKDGSVYVSPEHNARSNKEERKAAEERGGVFIHDYIYNKAGDRGLQMTRDIGFYAMGDVLTRYPDIYKLTICEGDILMIGSDGLLDPAHYDAEGVVRRLARLVLEGAEAQELIDDALRRQTGDNVTVIVYRN